MFIFKQTPTKVVELKEDNFKQEAYIEGFLIENIGLLETGEDSEAELLGRQVFLEKKDRIDLLVLTLEAEKAKLKIIEIKKKAAGKKALHQLERYINLWSEKGVNILRREGLTDTIDECLKKWEIKKKQQTDALSRKVGGILVAPGFEDDLIQEFSRSKKVQGIRLSRCSSSETPEAFIFLEYFPEVRRPTAVTAEEFWKGRSDLRKREFGEILKKLRKEDPDITHKYWKVMISIYPTPEEAEKPRPYRIARYLHGDKKLRFKKHIRIPLSNADKIVNKVLKEKMKYLKAASKQS